jgi:DNA invertase Pin-like site-specific DNA recombinase
MKTNGFIMALIGYARVSTVEQKLDYQLDALEKSGCKKEHIFVEKASGKTFDRPILNKCLEFLREGDTLVFCHHDRITRGGLADGLRFFEKLTQRGIYFRSLEEPIDTSQNSLSGEVTKNITLCLAAWQREVIASKTREGLEAARLRGRKGGRRFVLPPDETKKMLILHSKHICTCSELAKMFNLRLPTFYKYLRVAKANGTYPDNKDRHE